MCREESMKNLFVFLFSLILSVVFSTSASAYGVMIDGIYYNLNPKGKTAEVTYGEEKYSGEVVIPSSITSQGEGYTVTSIGTEAFYYCEGLTSVTIPNSVTSIERNAFSGCTGLTTVTIPNSVKSIGTEAFLSCSGLTSVDIPNSVKSIGGRAFYCCRGLTSVTIPNSVTSIGDCAFSGCSRLNDVIIVNKMFAHLPETYSGHYSIPETISQIIGGAFEDCSGLTSVTIPNSVTYISDNTFYNCSSLTSIIIPNSVTTIGANAFEYCSSLTSVTIGNSVRSIENRAFANCLKLENVYCYAEKAPSMSDTAFTGSYIDYLTLYVPSSALSSYKGNYKWNGFGTIKEIPSTIQAVVSSTDIATYCSPLNLDFTDFNGVNAYIASKYNSVEGTITMTKVDEVPAGTGFILKGSPKTYNIPVKSVVNTSFDNLLVGTVVKTEVPGTSNGYDNYILGNGVKGTAFYKSNGASPLAANKAYLRLPASGSSSAKAVRMSFDDDATTEILLLGGENTEETATSPVYDLNGMQKSGISKGWNIVNGKKILIKK